MSMGVKVAEVARGEGGDVHLKLVLAHTSKVCIACKVQQRELHLGGDPLGWELPLYRPEVAWPVLVFTRCHAEQRLEDYEQPFTVNRQEEMIKALQAAPCETPQELKSGAASLQKGFYVHVNGGTQGTACRKSLVFRCPQQYGKQGHGGYAVVHHIWEEQAPAVHYGLAWIRLGKATVRRQGAQIVAAEQACPPKCCLMKTKTGQGRSQRQVKQQSPMEVLTPPNPA